MSELPMADGGKKFTVPRERCETCRFWRAAEDNPPSPEGWCQKHAPHPTIVAGLSEERGGGSEDVIWPFTQRHNWCGEWQAKAGQQVPTMAPEAIVASLDADAIRARLEHIDRERSALLVLIRAANRKNL